MSEADDREDLEDGEGEEEETPQVLVATLADLGSHLPESFRKSFGARPCWFLLECDQDLVEIFDRLPEDPMPKGRAQDLLRAIRSFADENSDKLQELLGPTDGIVFGFHGDASLAQVTEAFEEDGFMVWSGVLRDGVISIPEE